MNKRQRKKQQARADKQALQDWMAFTQEFAGPWQKRFAYFDHRRRRWRSSREWRRRQAQLQADVEGEKAAIRERLKTHDYTLASWIPKPQSKVKR
jgi:hypothetical protein